MNTTDWKTSRADEVYKQKVVSLLSVLSALWQECDHSAARPACYMSHVAIAHSLLHRLVSEPRVLLPRIECSGSGEADTYGTTSEEDTGRRRRRERHDRSRRSRSRQRGAWMRHLISGPLEGVMGTWETVWSDAAKAFVWWRALMHSSAKAAIQCRCDPALSTCRSFGAEKQQRCFSCQESSWKMVSEKSSLAEDAILTSHVSELRFRGQDFCSRRRCGRYTVVSRRSEGARVIVESECALSAERHYIQLLEDDFAKLR